MTDELRLACPRCGGEVWASAVASCDCCGVEVEIECGDCRARWDSYGAPIVRPKWPPPPLVLPVVEYARAEGFAPEVQT